MKLFIFLVGAALALTLATYPARQLHAQVVTPSVSVPQDFTFGMVGLAAGQAARLNALMLPAGGPIVAGGSCQVTFTFLDDQGASLATKTLPVTQNGAVQFDYPATAATSLVEIRGTVQAAFSITPGASTAAPASCTVVPTMEVFNPTSGQTTLVLENAHALPQVVPLTVAP